VFSEPSVKGKSTLVQGLILLAACTAGFCVQSPQHASGVQKPSTCEGLAGHPDVVQFQMQNVNFRVSRDVVLEVHALRGSLQSTKPDVPITLDDADTFAVNIDSAQVAITPQSLTSLMKSYVLAYEGAPLKNVTVSIEHGKLVQKGTVHKGVDLPFEIEGSVSATQDGNIRVHADKIKSAHIPVKGLLHLLGEDLSKLVNQNAGRGMTVSGDDIILTPRTLTPPPHLIGHVTRVSIVGGKIVQVFGPSRTEPPLTPPLRATSYIYHRGGILRFGKFTMNDADLEIVGNRPGVFDFFQREYQKQLVAGYSKSTSSNGLIAHMVDYSRLSAKNR
jgi:hypothetical protein